MPTVIDSLIVTLGLDPTNFTRGQKQAAADFLKTKQEAERTAKEMEARGKQAAEFFHKIRNEVLALFSAFLVGRGLKEFIADLTRSDTALGNVAKQLDMSANELYAWQQAARASGGSAAGVTSTLQNLQGQLSQYRLTGEAGPAIGYFNALGIQVKDANGHWRTSADLLKELAGRLQNMDPALAARLLQSIGADEGTIALLFKGQRAVNGLIQAYRKLAPSPADITAANNRLKAFVDLDAELTKFGRDILTQVTPYLVDLMQWLTRIVDKNRDWIAQDAGRVMKDFATWVKSVDWAQIGKDAEAFADAVHKLVEQLGGAKNVAEGFLAAWAAVKVARIVSSIGLISGALSGVAAIPLGTGALAAILGGEWLHNLREASPNKGKDWRDAINPYTGERLGGSEQPNEQPTGRSKSFLDWWNEHARWDHILGRDSNSNSTTPQPQSYAPGGPGGFQPVAYSRDVTPGGATYGERTSFIQMIAKQLGIDPRVALQVSASEGLGGKVGDRGTSFGDYQLHVGGGLGDVYQQMTGHDPRDPTNWREQDAFALWWASQKGWSAWHGWRGAPFAGIGARAGMTAGRMAEGGPTNTTTTDVHIQTLNVYSKADNAAGIAKDISAAIKRSTFTSKANYSSI